MFAPIAINKLYTPLGELVPAKIAGELGLPYCLSTARSQPIEAVARGNDEGAASRNKSNEVWSYDGPNGGEAQSPRFYQLYMGHDDAITLSLLHRAWRSGLRCLDAHDRYVAARHVCASLTTAQLAHQVLLQGSPSNEIGESDPVFMKKYGEDLKKEKGKWIDSHVWHGKAHTWDKVKWLIQKWKEVSGGRPFVLKGIQSVEDAIKEHEVGCDGIVVTNHAGRQVDGAVGSLDVLPEIAKALEPGELPTTCASPTETAPTRAIYFSVQSFSSFHARSSLSQTSALTWSAAEVRSHHRRLQRHHSGRQTLWYTGFCLGVGLSSYTRYTPFSDLSSLVESQTTAGKKSTESNPGADWLT
ncbi:FMN-linked oxidoreductase [Sistotremastrum niveocremeum HHB9708]|uniref:FMN-linked oxidoreductase n=1 Tax=Sistotremastrum niveocremeum HHB9708 TaxID=1314777 RepID=A0A164UWQ1_9AGAM|nr:FMN-linked oxidoreductase [Sistotremastrum niveocremeum HHB9708]